MIGKSHGRIAEHFLQHHCSKIVSDDFMEENCLDHLKLKAHRVFRILFMLSSTLKKDIFGPFKWGYRGHGVR